MTNDRLEAKLGFDKVREIISDKCKTDYAATRVAEEEFSTSRATILKRLQLAEEMRLILMFEENFPTTGYIDGQPFLAPLQKEGSSIDVLGLAKLKTLLDTTRRLTSFFSGVKDGIYPGLKSLSAPITNFPEINRRIETILDRYGDIKDSASPELFDIRKRLRDKEGAISRRATAILKQAQESGLVDADASVTIRDGKYLIPIATASKRKLPGFVYDESATGKTTFVEPAEIIEIENEISELLFAQTREIARILREFTAFLRPYLPEVLASAAFIGEIDFLMAKAQTALDFIAGMPEGPPPAAGARPRKGGPRHRAAYRHPHARQAHPPYLRPQCRRQVCVPQDGWPAAVHVPVGHAHPYIGDFRAAGLQPHLREHRRRPVSGKRPQHLQLLPLGHA